eukprot:COSAG02_NODE_71934_length_189_cov_4.755556_1_plen_30_part_10
MVSVGVCSQDTRRKCLAGAMNWQSKVSICE